VYNPAGLNELAAEAFSGQLTKNHQNCLFFGHFRLNPPCEWAILKGLLLPL
jgi:hypothetical protein